MNTQGALNLLFRAGLRKDFRDEWDRHEPQYPLYLKTGSIDVPEFAAAVMTGVSRLIEIDDGEPITYQSPKLGPKVMAVDREFALGIQFTRKAQEDDQYGKLRNSVKWLAHAGRMTYEYRAASLLDDAFSGSVYKGFDGQPLCSTAHTFLNNPVSGQTWSNSITPAVGLSYAGITSLMDLFQTAKDHNGDPIRMMLDTLVIGNNAFDYNRALQIFGSDKEPFTAENQDNAVKKRLPKVNIVPSLFKSSTKTYFGIDSRYNDAHLLVRRPMKFEDGFDFNTKSTLFSASTRFMVFFVDPRGWAGSNAS